MGIIIAKYSKHTQKRRNMILFKNLNTRTYYYKIEAMFRVQDIAVDKRETGHLRAS